MALFTSISICASAAAWDPASAEEKADFAASNAAVTDALSISSILTASGQEISYRDGKENERMTTIYTFGESTPLVSLINQIR
jgi:hypothetical protein